MGQSTNLYAGLSELAKQSELFIFSTLVVSLQTKLKFSNINFYTSFSPVNPNDPQTEFWFKRENLFYKDVRNVPELKFFKGHRSPSSGKEKGVDVALATDMVFDVCRNKPAEIILTTGDADFSYLVRSIRKEKIPVTLVCLSNRFPLGLAFQVNKIIVLDADNTFETRFAGDIGRIKEKIEVLRISDLTNVVDINKSQVQVPGIG